MPNPWKKEVIIGDCRLLLGDCLEILPTLDDYDAIITDPPYGIGFGYSTHNDDPASYSNLMAALKGKPLALLQYPEEMMRYCVPVLGAPDECLAWVYPSNLPRQFRLWGLWGIRANFNQFKQPARNPESGKVKNLQVASYDWWEQPQVKNTSAEKTAHPCQIPVSSVIRVIRLTQTHKVLDTFMGSGTTGVACANLDRPFIGIEKDDSYFDIACERITNAYRQERLFS